MIHDGAPRFPRAFLLGILVLLGPLLWSCGRAITAATSILPGGEVQEGEQLFSLSCAKCHDQDAEGDGPEHSRHMPPPSNLTLVRNTADMSYSIVFKGVPGTAMPAHPYIPRGVFEKVNQFVLSRPKDTTREWDYPWTLEHPEETDLQFGGNLYVTACAGCHGLGGGGESVWANDPRVWPKPANFHARNSVAGRLYFIISHGRSGTMMAPQKEKFPPMARWALANYVHSFFNAYSSAAIEAGSPAEKLENPYSRDAGQIVESGHEVYQLYCAACHGPQAKGSFLAPRLTDRYWMYGSGKDMDLFLVIEKGIPGKLMPSNRALDEQQRWQVITYIRHRGGLPHPLVLAE
jgi:mono/diheme cytochrome c family protein